MLPDKHGRYGRYGGRFVPETLMPALLELEKAYHQISRDKAFKDELAWYLRDYVGRPTPLYFARHLTAALAGRLSLRAAAGNGNLVLTSRTVPVAALRVSGKGFPDLSQHPGKLLHTS